MSEILDKLARCEQVSEWIDPLDGRLVSATGETPPNSGASIREDWGIQDPELVASLVHHVKRLLVTEVAVHQVGADFSRDAWGDRVTLQLPSVEIWAMCFPVDDKTKIFTSPDGRRSWAGVGICAPELGLAIFSHEIKDSGVEARIQPVPKEVLAKLI